MWKIEKGLGKKYGKIETWKKGKLKKNEKKRKNNPYFRLFFKGFPALNLPFKALFYIKQ